MTEDDAATGAGVGEGRATGPTVRRSPVRHDRPSPGDPVRPLDAARSRPAPRPSPGRHRGSVCLRRYRRSWLRFDVFAGISVVAYLVPQVMAYTALVGVPPVSRAVDRLGGAGRVRRVGLVAGAVGGSGVDDRPDDRDGDRPAGRRRRRAGGGAGRRAQPDRRRVVSGRPDRPPRRDLRPAVAAPARRLPRRCGRADGRRAVGQDDRHDRRGRQPRRPAAVLRRAWSTTPT